MSLNYPKAPIIEAAIDFGVVQQANFDSKILAKFSESEREKYENIINISEFRVDVTVKEDGVAPPTIPLKSQIGLMCTSTVSGEIYQARINGFTYSKLAPYENWDKFRDEAQRLWTAYRTLTKPLTIGRLALRFINRLDLPLPVTDFKDWLRTVPEVAPEIEQALSAMVLQFQSPQPDLNAMLNFTEAIVPPAKVGVCSIVLDIDVFSDRNIPQDDCAIWALFEQLRDRKNLVFEKCITDKTRELFK